MSRVLLILFLMWSGSSFAKGPQVFFLWSESKQNYLKLEFLADDLFHFEFGMSTDLTPTWQQKIWYSPMVDQLRSSLDSQNQNSAGLNLESRKIKPAQITRINDTKFQTPNLIVKVNLTNLCFETFDRVLNKRLHSVCSADQRSDVRKLILSSDITKNVYGLGSYFVNPGTADGDWIGRVWDPMETPGNAMRNFSGGANGYAMFPVIYVLGSGKDNYGFFFDHPFKQKWSFVGDQWTIETDTGPERGFIFTGDSLGALRKRYMQMTGFPMVPPRSVFGLWVSRFGFESWNQLENELTELENEGFPVDGFALDLQWFGGKFYGPGTDVQKSRMGSLSFDTTAFPEPEKKIQELKNQRGVELLHIEEPYVSKWLPEFRELTDQGFLARDCQGSYPTILSKNPWWGIGGMIDYTNRAAGAYWHDSKRQKLVDNGIRIHWTDLSEPEEYSPGSCYAGYSELGLYKHKDIHNIYSLMWARSIFDGYKRNRVEKRHFIMTRSGTSGIQRYGAGMWSGDIASNTGALTAHLNVQMHMSLSGIDYYGSDVGGFHRTPIAGAQGGGTSPFLGMGEVGSKTSFNKNNINCLDGDINELYTQWFANSVLFDFPVRPHTWSYGLRNETSPVRIGHKQSNLANILLRYELFPYYYSLGHRAYEFGEPIVEPMVYEFQEDLNVRTMGHQKMVGPFLMAGVVAGYKEIDRSIYFPKGEWVEYHSGEYFSGSGNFEPNIPNVRNGILRLPLFVRDGAIIPVQRFMKGQRNISGFLPGQIDRANSNEVRFKIFPSVNPTKFALYEDDGDTLAYREGEVYRTMVSQSINQNQAQIEIASKEGYVSNTLNLTETNEGRKFFVEVILPHKQIAQVSLDSRTFSDILPQCPQGINGVSETEARCWYQKSRSSIEVLLGKLSDFEHKHLTIKTLQSQAETTSALFVCKNSNTSPGISTYVSGNVPVLGSFDPRKAIKLEPSAYPSWTEVVGGLPVNQKIEWKCLKRKELGDGYYQYSEGENESFVSSAEDYSGKQESTFR